VTITDRKKDLLKTSGGKYVAPVKIEALLKAQSFIQEAVVIGDNRHYCVALFSLDPENFGEWAKTQGIPAEPGHAKVREFLAAHVKEVNKALASFESIKYFVKRKAGLRERYKDLIDSMYTGKEKPGAD
jgi:long-chain acyl-CoA synthetase